MNKHATKKLFVNLSASQVRKRLKGYGFGVKRVEAADRNQAVIFHTATGHHQEELERLFADASPSASKAGLGTPVDNLRNVGPASAARLKDVGVDTREDLERLGPVLTYRLVAQRYPQTSLNLLWALAATLADRDWRLLSPEEKRRLRRELNDE